MALVIHRRLAIPLWTIAFFTVVFIAPPPATLFLITVLGIAVIALATSGVPWLRRSRSAVHVLWYGRDNTSAAIAVAAGTRLRTLDDPTGSTADDALDLVRMDDDGGWQMAQPPA